MPRICFLLIAALILSGCDDDDRSDPLTVGWGGTEGDPACVYSAREHTVEAKVTIDGTADKGDEVTVTVTAYADENTSRAVGSRTRSVPVTGTVHQDLVLTIPVEKEPHVDEDGVAACRLDVDY